MTEFDGEEHEVGVELNTNVISEWAGEKVKDYPMVEKLATQVIETSEIACKCHPLVWAMLLVIYRWILRNFDKKELLSETEVNTIVVLLEQGIKWRTIPC